MNIRDLDNNRRRRREIPRRHVPRSAGSTEEAIPSTQNNRIRYESQINIDESIKSWNELYHNTIKSLFKNHENVNRLIDSFEEPREIASYTLKSTEIGAKLVDLLHKGHKTGVIDINDNENTELTEYDVNAIIEKTYTKLMEEMKGMDSASEKITYLAQRDLLREELKKDMLDNQIFDLLVRLKNDQNSHKLLTKIDNLRKLVNTSSKKPADILRLAEYAEIVEQSDKSIDIIEVLEKEQPNDDNKRATS
jgi:hypothetical protein